MNELVGRLPQIARQVRRYGRMAARPTRKADRQDAWLLARFRAAQQPAPHRPLALEVRVNWTACCNGQVQTNDPSRKRIVWAQWAADRALPRRSSPIWNKSFKALQDVAGGRAGHC